MPDLSLLERPGTGDQTLVLLHGRGADEHDLFGLFDILDPQRRYRGITVGGPLRLPPGGKHWYVVSQVGYPEPDTFHSSYSALQDLLDPLVDWSRTVVGGFSQGSVMASALSLGTGRPLPAGLLVMSGFIPTVAGWEPELTGRTSLPVLWSHGTQDPVISVEFAQQGTALLEAGGLSVELHETPMAHTIDPRVIPAISAWLAARAQG